ncbi:hypothetical protein Pla123a_28410 [Posidoniimonas polymericola]|uniref:Uncharacterized protein n=1 Tax=Posidoniimonas polymericola TaxID=2528002 RepID=A0A5C5YMH4_9BACT|nr:hypothetical protein Pla123a_28410 [Posidoniimonas polymericola]
MPLFLELPPDLEAVRNQPEPDAWYVILSYRRSKPNLRTQIQ